MKAIEPFRRLFQALCAGVFNQQAAKLNSATMTALFQDKPASSHPQITVKLAGGSVPYGHTAMFSHFAAFEIRRWPRGKDGRYTLSDSIFCYGRFRLCGNPLEEWAQAKTEADASLSLSSISRAGRRQRNSRIDLFEVQNNDGYMIPYGGETKVDGRHIQLDLYLSKPMWSAVLSCMLSAHRRTRDQHTKYAIVIPLDDKFEGRPITLHSDEPFSSKVSLPCRELVVLQTRYRGSAIDRTHAHYLTEWSVDEC